MVQIFLINYTDFVLDQSGRSALRHLNKFFLPVGIIQKEREMPRAKKPSPLKKVILKEREQRKRLRLLDGDPDSASSIAGR